MNHARPEVTRDDVERLWSAAIEGRSSWRQTSERAEALIEHVNSENPIVNWGLLTLYYLKQPTAGRDVESLSASRERWRAQLREYDADPVGWMRAYFQRMLLGFADAHGKERARAFGRKLVGQGHLTDLDVIDAVGPDRPR